ncbi:MAG: ribosome biogenesis GTPase Der [Magnetococcales bacterium]|nr:ribosome biogenesis GTPase Der [Magnetococcales bacterium]MBF0156424.1 ribosome biogenesis GTPase Der [Magnetococcales bacterium]
MSCLLALVGRPNVGKSSLFNRLTASRRALVDSLPGATRDRQYGEGKWSGGTFRVVDTGGFEGNAKSGESEAIIKERVREQMLAAVAEADGLILVTDGQSGPVAEDWEMAALLRRTGKPVTVAVNKTEGRGGMESALTFHELGIRSVVAISAAHGQGIEALLAELMGSLVGCGAEEGEPDPAMATAGIRVAIIGRPNVGKSTLVNRLIGDERMIVSAVAGTTRDSIDLPLEDKRHGRFVLVDTAGIRRRGRITLRMEKFSVMSALASIERAEVAVLVLDAEAGIAEQDQRVAGLAWEAGRGMVFAVNKWDQVKGGRGGRRLFLEEWRRAFPRLGSSPLLFLSGLTGEGVGALLPAVKAMRRAWGKRIGTGPLNRWFEEAVGAYPPPRDGGGRIKLRYITQVGVEPPAFVIFANRPEGVEVSYCRYLENRLRESFDLGGVPLKLMLRKGENPFE